MSTQTVTKSKLLRLIKGKQGELANLMKRAKDNFTHKAEEDPPFKFSEQMNEWRTTSEYLSRLRAILQKSNAQSMIKVGDNEISVSHAISRLAEVKAELAFYSELVSKDGLKEEKPSFSGRYMGETGETKVIIWKSALSAQGLVEKQDALRSEVEELNDALEEHNASTRVQLS